jgi:hypothetical protein
MGAQPKRSGSRHPPNNRCAVRFHHQITIVTVSLPIPEGGDLPIPEGEKEMSTSSAKNATRQFFFLGVAEKKPPSLKRVDSYPPPTFHQREGLWEMAARARSLSHTHTLTLTLCMAVIALVGGGEYKR